MVSFLYVFWKFHWNGRNQSCRVLSSSPEQNGVHVNSEDPFEIARGVKETLLSPEKAKNWGANGRKRVLGYFTWR